jgi:cell division FtsZ-interacting protein ZapD
MIKQYVYIETLETGEKVRYTFSNMVQLRHFVNTLLSMSDMPEQFEIKTEYVGISI